MIVPYSKQTVLRQRIWVLQLSRSRTRSEGLWAVDNCTNTGKQKLRNDGTERRLRQKNPGGGEICDWADGVPGWSQGPKAKILLDIVKKTENLRFAWLKIAKTAILVPGTSAVKKSHRKFLAKFQFFLDVIVLVQQYIMDLFQNDGHRKIYFDGQLRLIKAKFPSKHILSCQIRIEC